MLFVFGHRHAKNSFETVIRTVVLSGSRPAVTASLLASGASESCASRMIVPSDGLDGQVRMTGLNGRANNSQTSPKLNITSIHLFVRLLVSALDIFVYLCIYVLIYFCIAVFDIAIYRTI